MFAMVTAGLATMTTGGRKRAAIELIGREEAELRRTAARYSLCADDAEDAYQRALEILLLKAPTENPRELVRWTQTVVKHEALAIRHARERMLGSPPPRADGDEPLDRVALIPARGAGPDERLESHERIARSREALSALKPAELRALTLLAAGYTYAEIGEMTGFSQTKVNRCLSEGRERYRQLVSRGEDGSRCREMGPLLSAFCDGELSPAQARTVREHLRACTSCRAAMRAYRAAPATVAALAPALPLSRSLLERAQELLVGAQARLASLGGAGDGGATQVAAAGGGRGLGAAALAKLVALCAGTAGGAACVVAGVAPAPLDLTAERSVQPRIERVAPAAIEPEPAPAEPQLVPAPAPEPEPEPEPREQAAPEPAAATAEPPPGTAAGAVEYTSPPAQAPPAAASGGPSAPGGSPAGEFGP